ncbi:ras association domain-containing protein 1 [Trichonephila clavipes]|nr:ras association domain-containing protein 1 [Trichonephila clavipes]
MNLTRPINVIAGTRPPSIYDILKDEDDGGRKTLTSFYLPRDTVKALHITSEFSAREVINALLKKFKVADNSHKFALYERTYQKGSNQAKLRRIQDQEIPLVLALLDCDEDKHFVLQENETEDIIGILFSDEAHFWLNGYVNKINCRIWSEANPQVHVETSLHPEKLTVWCALWAGGILLQKR